MKSAKSLHYKFTSIGTTDVALGETSVVFARRRIREIIACFVRKMNYGKGQL